MIPHVDGARTLAHNIVSMLDMMQSYVSVHMFNEAAYVIQEMTNEDVSAAIEAYGTQTYPISGGTDIGMAFSQISSTSTEDNHVRIVILITDGEGDFSDPSSAFVAYTMANALKDADFLIYTLIMGAGQDVNMNVVNSLSSAPSSHFVGVGTSVELWTLMNENLCDMCDSIQGAWEGQNCCDADPPPSCHALLQSASAAQCSC